MDNIVESVKINRKKFFLLPSHLNFKSNLMNLEWNSDSMIIFTGSILTLYPIMTRVNVLSIFFFENECVVCGK